MKSSTTIKMIFNCSLESAFKTPMLSDVRKIHTGYSITPKVTHTTEDESWGKVGGSRKIFMEKNTFFPGGESGLDTVLERIENKYWKIEIGELKHVAFGIEKFQGEWMTREIEPNKIEVTYRYSVFSKNNLYYVFHWYLTNIIWRDYMKHAMKNIKVMAENNEPYLYS